jgi:hypothetical protein
MNRRAWLIAAALLATGAGFYLETAPEMPQNALIRINESTKEYTSPPCYTYGHEAVGEGFTRSAKLSEISGQDYRRERECRRKGGFSGEARKLWFSLLLPGGSRWNEDGTWRY